MTIEIKSAMIEETRPPIAMPDRCLRASPIAELTMPPMDKIRFQMGIQHPKSEKMPNISPTIAMLLFFIGMVS